MQMASGLNLLNFKEVELQTVFIVVKDGSKHTVVGNLQFEEPIDEIKITEYDEDEYGEYETTRTYEVQDIPIYGGLALTQIVIVPDVQTAELILV